MWINCPSWLLIFTTLNILFRIPLEQLDYIGIMKDLVIFYLFLWALSALVLVIILHPESSNVYV